MISGTMLLTERRATIGLRIRNQENLELNVDAVIDTGFSESLTLPLALVEALGLVRTKSVEAELADGTRVVAQEFRGRIFWNDGWLEIPIQASGRDPLFGMALLLNHVLTIEVQDGGMVSIEPLE